MEQAGVEEGVWLDLDRTETKDKHWIPALTFTCELTGGSKN